MSFYRPNNILMSDLTLNTRQSTSSNVSSGNIFSRAKSDMYLIREFIFFCIFARVQTLTFIKTILFISQCQLKLHGLTHNIRLLETLNFVARISFSNSHSELNRIFNSRARAFCEHLCNCNTTRASEANIIFIKMNIRYVDMIQVSIMEPLT